MHGHRDTLNACTIFGRSPSSIIIGFHFNTIRFRLLYAPGTFQSLDDTMSLAASLGSLIPSPHDQGQSRLVSPSREGILATTPTMRMCCRFSRYGSIMLRSLTSIHVDIELEYFMMKRILTTFRQALLKPMTPAGGAEDLKRCTSALGVDLQKAEMKSFRAPWHQQAPQSGLLTGAFPLLQVL